MTDFSELAQRYLVLIGGVPPSNYSAWSPDVPGCVATGATLDEVERDMRSALAVHLDGLSQDRVELPDASGPGVYVQRDRTAA